MAVKNRVSRHFLSSIIGILSFFSLGFSLPLIPFHLTNLKKFPQEPDPTPTVDRMAVPALSANPTQVETGENLYFYHCMPCHGDFGQGLTDEFRGAWVEDHQNCWASGCHAGRVDDGGFPIPKFVPAVIGSETAPVLQKFATDTALYTYLKETHPPQTPGILEEHEYWALTAYLFAENGRLAPDVELGSLEDEKFPNLEKNHDEMGKIDLEETVSISSTKSEFQPSAWVLILLGILAGTILFFRIKKKTREASSKIQESTSQEP